MARAGPEAAAGRASSAPPPPSHFCRRFLEAQSGLSAKKRKKSRLDRAGHVGHRQQHALTRGRRGGTRHDIGRVGRRPDRGRRRTRAERRDRHAPDRLRPRRRLRRALPRGHPHHTPGGAWSWTSPTVWSATRCARGAGAAATPSPMPKGVHVAVVDPQVGGPSAARSRSVPARTSRGGWDNGLLSRGATAGDVGQVVDITRSIGSNPVSATFHGRGIFAPVAAHLAAGGVADRATLARVELPAPDSDDGAIVAHHFGNANVDHERLAGTGLTLGGRVAVETGGERYLATYALVRRVREPVMYARRADHLAAAAPRRPGAEAERAGRVAAVRRRARASGTRPRRRSARRARHRRRSARRWPDSAVANLHRPAPPSGARCRRGARDPRRARRCRSDRSARAWATSVPSSIRGRAARDSGELVGLDRVPASASSAPGASCAATGANRSRPWKVAETGSSR